MAYIFNFGALGLIPSAAAVVLAHELNARSVFMAPD